ncbi:hypothetical protein QQP08_004276 [Theobroma cacao]|nr:hypothetical protein QQP08_004276 [Theobroma cacao]
MSYQHQGIAATKWKDSSSGLHVVRDLFMINSFADNLVFCNFHCPQRNCWVCKCSCLFGKNCLVEMILSLLHRHLNAYIEVDYHGRAIRTKSTTRPINPDGAQKGNITLKQIPS